MAKIKYESDIKLGERYVDNQTGFEGVATSTTFYQHACERVGLEAFNSEQKKISIEIFDAPRLTHVETGKVATTRKTGGDRPVAEQHRPTR